MRSCRSETFHQPPSQSHRSTTESTLVGYPTGSIVRSLPRGPSREALGEERARVLELAVHLGTGATTVSPGLAGNIFTPSA